MQAAGRVFPLLVILVLVQSKSSADDRSNSQTDSSLGKYKKVLMTKGNHSDRITEPTPVGRCRAPRTQRGDPQGPCTRLGRMCVKEAKCDIKSQTCQCPENYSGDGTLQCSPSNSYMCTLSADPHLKTYSGARVDVSLPCSYCVSKFYIPWSDAGKKRFTHFVVQVLAVNILTPSSLYFVDQVSVKFHLAYLNESTGHETFASARMSTLTSSSIILSVMRNKHRAWTMPERLEMGNLTIHNEWDDVDKFAVFSVPKLQLFIKFRPPLSAQPQVRTPGVVVRIPINTQFFDNNDNCLCQHPKQGADIIRQQKKELGLPDRHLVPYFEVLEKNISEPAHQFAESCGLSKNVFHRCGDRKAFALRICNPLLKNKSLTTCLMAGAVDPVVLFSKCLSWTCLGSMPACRDVFSGMLGNSCRLTSLMKQFQCSTTMHHLSMGRRKGPNKPDDHK